MACHHPALAAAAAAGMVGGVNVTVERLFELSGQMAGKR